MSEYVSKSTEGDEKLLSLHVMPYFARDQYIIPALNRMQDDNIYTLGDLIKHTETELVSKYRISLSNRKKLHSLVENFGLKFA